MIREHLKDRKWEHPSDYGGYSPDGDYMLGGQSRDSHALERSNYQRVLEDLEAEAAKHPEPDDGEPWVHDFRASHWAVGWVEQIIVRADAPAPVLDLAEEIVCRLADYPVYDESHFGELEHTEVSDYWERCSVAERVKIIKDSGSSASIFAARSDCYPDDDGHVYECLTTA